MANRMISMHRINESLYLCTEKPRNIEVDKKTLKYENSKIFQTLVDHIFRFRFKQVKGNTKPIVLMISWFYGKPAQINKYCKLYTDHGIDVLVGQITLTQFLLSIKSAEVKLLIFY